MNKHEMLADLLFGNIKTTKEELLIRYPRRNPDTVVTRFSPSPTGFLHIGGVYTALIAERFAHQNNGVFYLRLEDTDQKREIKGSRKIICSVFAHLGIKIDEGIISETEEIGSYGPYVQSKRKEIYHALAKDLVKRGLAYPCFMTDEEIKAVRELQKELKQPLGIYGEYSKYRGASYEEVSNKLKVNKKFVLRLRVPADKPQRCSIEDLIKGHLEFENNNNDIVLLKEDGLPTYHFAHACDDTLMGTTHVIRSDEWMPSIPVHLQLFEALEFPLPKYAHPAPVMKQDGKSRRKLSKRKDPESNAEYYLQQGYLTEALFAYLFTLINSDFEAWYLENNMPPVFCFPLSFQKMGVSGALYDLEKLNSIASELMYRITPEEHLANLTRFASLYNEALFGRIEANKHLAYRLLQTQGRDSHEHRKDLVCYNNYLDIFGYFYADIFDLLDNDYQAKLSENITADTLTELLPAIVSYIKDPQEATIKDLSKELGFTDKKKYEKAPELYRGLTHQFYKTLRLLITKHEHGISLDDIMAILGSDEIIRRIESWTLKKH